jgi:hypothetical protein
MARELRELNIDYKPSTRQVSILLPDPKIDHAPSCDIAMRSRPVMFEVLSAEERSGQASKQPFGRCRVLY